MKLITGQNIRKALEDGHIVYMEHSNFIERRLYRLNLENKTIEYKDYNKSWTKSSIEIEDMISTNWIIEER